MSSIRDLEEWVRGSALPLWSETGFDPENGRFQERLDPQAQPVTSIPIRAMVQARQIYVFAHAAKLGWHPGGAEKADRAMRSLVRDFCTRSGGQASFAFSIDPSGQVVSAVRDAYAHAFVLFAIAWLHEVTGDRTLVDLADETVAFLDAELADAAHGGLVDQRPLGAERGKRQNPQMHLLEAYLALDRSMPGRGHLDRAASLVRLFRDRMFDPRHGVLLEYFAEDWSAHPDPQKRSIFEPGHHFEWVWLLREFQDATGEDQGPWLRPLYDSALRFGRTADALIFDEVLAGGEALRRSHRIWPHTEGLKAAAVFHRDGDATARPFAEALARNLTTVFLDRPFRGGWIDHVTEERQPLVAYVPASTLYHVVLAATETAKAFADTRP